MEVMNQPSIQLTTAGLKMQRVLFLNINCLYNKCVSRLARCKSHHTALVDAAAPNSDCLPSLVPNSESPPSLDARRRRSHPSAASKCARPLLLHAGCIERMPFVCTRVGVGSAKRIFCP